jgi:hypothetical protein
VWQIAKHRAGVWMVKLRLFGTDKSGHSDDAAAHVAGCQRAEEIFKNYGSGDFVRNIEIANELNAVGRKDDALYFFRKAFEINPQSPHVLFKILETQLHVGMDVPASEVQALHSLDRSLARFFEGLQATVSGRDTREVLEAFGDGFEEFHTGSEADWFYLRAAKKLVQNAPLPARQGEGPANLFFYWDKPNPPDEVAQNFQYHRNLGIFDVKVFSKESAEEFIYSNFGKDTADLFKKLRHPSEESDFVRFHAVYACGGYYLDVDEQVISTELFRSQFGEALGEIYILSDSGPVQSCFFGAKKGSPVIESALRYLVHNCYLRPDLSMWLKSGPGPITRALSRIYYRHLIKGEDLPEFSLLDPVALPNAFRAVPVSYRSDARDWRVFEAQGSR